MDQTDQLHQRGEALKAHIEAARQQVAADNKMEWAEIGNILESLSRDIEDSHHAADEHRKQVLDRVESDLASVQGRIASKPAIG